MHNLDLKICNAVLVGSSMLLSAYFGWSIIGGEGLFAGIMAFVCATAAFLVSALVSRASGNFKAGNWSGFLVMAILAGLAIAFNIVADYTTASIFRDQVLVQSDNSNVVAEQSRGEVQRLEKAIANLRGESAWRTKFEAPQTYDALIMEQKQKVDRGRNIYQRTKQCTDTTLPISSQVCSEIARLEAQKANAQRRQVILAELKTLGEQLAIARNEVETNKKVSNPALAQVRSITTWFRLDRSPTDHSDWWGAKSIMLYMTILLTALICFLGWELGQHRVMEPTPPQPRPRPNNRWIAAAPEHQPEPIPLPATDPPPTPGNNSTVIYSKTTQSHDKDAIRRLMAELEDEFGLQPKH